MKKIVPIKGEKEKNLFDKWSFLLNRETITKSIMNAYNFDVEKFLKTDEGQKYKE
jgi:hypothetical protein